MRILIVSFTMIMSGCFDKSYISNKQELEYEMRMLVQKLNEEKRQAEIQKEMTTSKCRMVIDLLKPIDGKKPIWSVVGNKCAISYDYFRFVVEPYGNLK
jgi:hypothetical protein